MHIKCKNVLESRILVKTSYHIELYTTDGFSNPILI